jgi:hypothetical protein
MSESIFGMRGPLAVDTVSIFLHRYDQIFYTDSVEIQECIREANRNSKAASEFHPCQKPHDIARAEPAPKSESP